LDQDTIVAIATAPGPGGIGIIRLSGFEALAIGRQLAGADFRPRHAHYCAFEDGTGQVLDCGIGLFFPAPHSFTGEDVVELQAHGGPVVLDMILRETCRLGARPARPGEFSLRAYLNNKIDLTQAEAIADLINSSTEQAARNASRSLRGDFSRRIEELVAQVTQLRVYIEAAIDFPEEEIDFIRDGDVKQRLDSILRQFDTIAELARQGNLVREGMKLVIAGKPNAGKSSLLNALSGQDTAIVTAIEGTTRDVLRERIEIDGMPLHIVDTAGLRHSADEIEREGIRRARTEMETADRILFVVDGNTVDAAVAEHETLLAQAGQHLPAGIPVTIVMNKTDLSDKPCKLTRDNGITVVHLSAKTGAGLQLLQHHLKECMGYRESGEGCFSARRRHLEALERARKFLLDGQHQLQHCGAAELLAEDLRLCQNSLGEITGLVSRDELLGKIFSSFCIGK
jgi:tRNA modification GTPase